MDDYMDRKLCKYCNTSSLCDEPQCECEGAVASRSKIEMEECNIITKDEQIKYLWELLDDISTAGDMFKPEINGYFKYVNDRCERRSKVATSDGYEIFIK